MCPQISRYPIRYELQKTFSFPLKSIIIMLTDLLTVTSYVVEIIITTNPPKSSVELRFGLIGVQANTGKSSSLFLKPFPYKLLSLTGHIHSPILCKRICNLCHHSPSVDACLAENTPVSSRIDAFFA